MIRAVVDTNTLISGIISPLGASAQIVRCWQRGDFLLVTSPALRDAESLESLYLEVGRFCHRSLLMPSNEDQFHR